MDWVLDVQLWISLLTLTLLEIVLGIDNIIFISILAGKLPSDQQQKARTVGIALALITRIMLLCSIVWLIGLTKPWFTIFAHSFSGKDLVLLLGGLFLIAKSTHEIHGSLEGEEGERSIRVRATIWSVVTQIILMDIVFSLDSVITAVGLAQQISVMIVAVILAVIVMLLSAGAISDFVNRHPTIKMLALSFLLMIGVMLVADAFNHHIPRGYIYFAMAFSMGVEMLNIRARGKRAAPVQFHQPYR
jgi:predicted tellurium resistance membrane protein TerC